MAKNIGLQQNSKKAQIHFTRRGFEILQNHWYEPLKEVGRGGVEGEESLMDRRGESREAGNLCSTLKKVTGHDCKMKLRDS